MNKTYKKERSVDRSENGDNKLISRSVKIEKKYIVYMLIGRYECNI
jgi:hypothetical protein